MNLATIIKGIKHQNYIPTLVLIGKLRLQKIEIKLVLKCMSKLSFMSDPMKGVDTVRNKYGSKNIAKQAHITDAEKTFLFHAVLTANEHRTDNINIEAQVYSIFYFQL